MSPKQTSFKMNEKTVLSNFQDWRDRRKPMFNLVDLVRTADIKRVFSTGGSTNWSYNLCTITEVLHNSIPSYRLNYLAERYNEKILLPTKLTLEENNQVMKNKKLIEKNKTY